MSNIVISTGYVKKLLPSTQNLERSARKVIGEKKDKNNRFKGKIWRGIKIPLINSKGNLIRFIINIISEVLSEGYAAANSPNEDPKIDIRQIPKNIKKIVVSEINTIENIKIKIIVMIDVIINEYRVEAMIIPNNISFNDIGETKIRSNDFSRVSMGKTTGLIAVAVKKAVIDTIPINTWFIEIFLPITQESVIKKGNIRPKIKTGPLSMYNETFFLLNIQILFKLSVIIF